MLEVLFYASLATLLLAPAAAAAIYWRGERRALSPRYCGIAATSLLLVIFVAHRSSWSLRGVSADIVLLLLVYIIYCLFAVSLLKVRSRSLRWPLFGLAAIPMLGGVLLATVGSLMLAFMIGDAEPVLDRRTAATRVCRVTLFGGATTSRNGYFVTEYYVPRIFPFIEKKLGVRRIYDEEVAHPPDLPGLCSHVG